MRSLHAHSRSSAAQRANRRRAAANAAAMRSPLRSRSLQLLQADRSVSRQFCQPHICQPKRAWPESLAGAQVLQPSSPIAQPERSRSAAGVSGARVAAMRMLQRSRSAVRSLSSLHCRSAKQRSLHACHARSAAAVAKRNAAVKTHADTQPSCRQST
ncbi:hypothetical protein WMY93_034139 [Mugilogobius chulae]|uniref:Uncharacterized protein n=1 Tax=Mugilogobius chulae TaxID=88201 RepID=A0AAW0MIQ1_9GOBI